MRGRRVLVTGHTGFKGSWLSLWLDRLGAHVYGLALDPPTTPAMYDACRLDAVVDSTIADVRDLSAVRRVLDCAQPEVVFHLAAQPIVRVSYDEPVATYETNVMGTINVLEAVRATSSVRAVVVVTSDKCYENREWNRSYHEGDPLGGHDPYSSSKACTEIAASAWARSFFGKRPGGPALATARAGNVIGGGDWGVDRLVPDAARALQAGLDLEVRNPTSVRPWQHVLEPLHGYLTLAEWLVDAEPGFEGAWNFGPEEASMLPVCDLADRFVGLWGSGGWVDVSGGEVLHEAKLLKLDSAKARAQLGWSPRLSLDDSLALTADWYRRFYDGEDVHALTLEQIDTYESAIEELAR